MLVLSSEKELVLGTGHLPYNNVPIKSNLGPFDIFSVLISCFICVDKHSFCFMYPSNYIRCVVPFICMEICSVSCQSKRDPCIPSL